ncbi:MAG: MATE family efflux transporter [bacterium]|jgi:putative MATE family efflux protein
MAAPDLSGAIRPILLKLALPVIASNLLVAVISFTDFKMVGWLGKEAIAALSMSRTALFIIQSAFMGAGIGATAYVARSYGAGRTDEMKRYAAQAVMMCIYISVPITLLGYSIGPGMHHWLGADPVTAGYGWDYLSMIYIGMSVIGLRFIVTGVMNALGRTDVPMYLNVAFAFLNLIFNFLLIPKWGMFGCALGTTLTSLLVFGYGVLYMHFKGWAAFAISQFSGAERAIRNMLALAGPAMLQVVARSGAGLLMYKVISLVPNSTVGAATLGLGLQGESISFMPGLAVMTASATLVGQALGAGRKDKAAETLRESRNLTLLIMILLGIVFFAFAREFMVFFTKDPDVIREGIRYLRINAFAQPIMAISFSGIGCLRGAGDTKYPFITTLLSHYLFRLPVAYLLGVSLGMGILGIWISFLISNVAEALLILHRLSQGKWLHIELKY